MCLCFINYLSGCTRSELWRAGAAVAARGVTSLDARRVSVPGLGIEPTPPALEGGLPTTGQPGESSPSTTVLVHVLPKRASVMALIGIFLVTNDFENIF